MGKKKTDNTINKKEITNGIVVKNLKKTYSGKEILKGISFEIPKGRVVGYIGDNGSGKTTSIKILIGVNKADEGTEITLDGININKERQGHKISYLPEKTYLPDYLTGREFLEYILKINDIDINEKKIKEITSRLNIFNALNNNITTYSKGMMQRLGIASCILNDKAEYFFLDEPVSGLDPVGQEQIIKMILELKQAGKTIFITSHQMNEIEELCDDVIFLKKGVIKNKDTVKNIIQKYKTLRNYYIDVSEQKIL